MRSLRRPGRGGKNCSLAYRRPERSTVQFNEQTAAMNASVEDLVELRIQLERALHAAGAGQS